MAEICSISQSYQGATARIFVSYTITDYPDRAVISSTLTGGANPGAQRVPINFSVSNGTSNTWRVNTTSYSGTSSVSFSASTRNTETTQAISSAQSITITKTHSAQSISVRVNLNGSNTARFQYQTTSQRRSISGSASGTISVAAKDSYNVTFAANGGTGVPATQVKWYNESLTISTTVPTRDKYNFLGWLGSDGNTYQPGATYTGNAALTLTAQWKKQSQLKVKVGGAWMDGMVKCKVNGEWVDAEAVYIKTNGTWHLNE
jgi:uncharacterized repeat protein (TIGR02543 family)